LKVQAVIRPSRQATPVVINAIIDALRPLGIDCIDMPATPSRVWQAIQSAKGSTLNARAKSEAR
jgi:hypothetical protein